MLDTNILLNKNFDLKDFENVHITSAVLEELDGLKKADGELGYLARKAIRDLEDYDVNYIIQDIYDVPEGWDASKRDNQIIIAAQSNGCKLYSNDFNVRIKAKSLDIECDKYEPQRNLLENSMGYIEKYLDLESEDDNKILEHVYKFPEDNIFDLKNNQYIILYDKNKMDEILGYDWRDQIIDKFKWCPKHSKMVSVRTKQVNNKFLGKVKPRNVHQELLFDLMQNDDVKIKLTTGKFGTGKDYCQIVTCFELIERGKYDKLVWVRNVVEVANSGAIGFLPGTSNEKLIPWAMPLADKIGGAYGLEMMVKNETVELQHFSTIRGRDFKNSIIYCTEVENMSIEHIQLLIGRIGEGSILVMNGDLKQVDKDVFKNHSGLKATIEKLSGHEDFGYVKLQKVERSRVAAMADLLD